MVRGGCRGVGSEEMRVGSGEAFDGEEELGLLWTQTRICRQADLTALRTSSAVSTSMLMAYASGLSTHPGMA